ncbi:hypothetical protein DJ90_6412 [Paenibacillus macerans]|uniref:Uncharacterized protein n=1 Tax=Paenibacillus macerans TaxID=44252 RepID=A0A091A559_PAEMA|nr:hypothetical protein DJ90_6412 [Paenibacillus macerans]
MICCKRRINISITFTNWGVRNPAGDRFAPENCGDAAGCLSR